MIYEIRTYTLKPCSPGEVEKRWAEAYEYRKKYSPLAAFWHTEIGAHIWAYERMDERLAVREQARKAGVWPPPGGRDELLAQTNKIMLPSAFSPLQ